MRILAVFLLALTACSEPADPPEVEVYLPTVPGFKMNRAFVRARVVVERIYSDIGVRIRWGSIRSAPTGCQKEPMHWRILMAVRTSSGSGGHGSAMAFSNPYSNLGPCVTLFIDQINSEVQANPTQSGYLVGHVLAHEIGHVLEGIARHSETGVMKGRYSLLDIAGMSMRESLRFTSHDAELIHAAFRPAGIPSMAARSGR